MSAFFLCCTAWAVIALGMDRHHEDALGQPGSAHHLRCLRRAGGTLLVLSLAPALRPWDGDPASVHLVEWAIALSSAAIAVVAAVTWIPQRTPLLAAATLAIGLAAMAGGR